MDLTDVQWAVLEPTFRPRRRPDGRGLAVDRSAGRHERRSVGPAHGRAVARPAIALSAVPDLPSSLPTLTALGPPRSAAAAPRRGPPGPRHDRSEWCLRRRDLRLGEKRGPESDTSGI